VEAEASNASASTLGNHADAWEAIERGWFFVLSPEILTTVTLAVPMRNNVLNMTEQAKEESKDRPLPSAV